MDCTPKFCNKDCRSCLKVSAHYIFSVDGNTNGFDLVDVVAQAVQRQPWAGGNADPTVGISVRFLCALSADRALYEVTLPAVKLGYEHVASYVAYMEKFGLKLLGSMGYLGLEAVSAQVSMTDGITDYKMPVLRPSSAVSSVGSLYS